MSLSGTVRDQQAAVIPGASISLRNLDTGQTHRTATDRTGDFHVIGIAPGRYEIRVELPGFTPFVEPDVGLSIGQEAALDVTLTVAAVTETIRRNSAREADFWQLDARLCKVLASSSVEVELLAEAFNLTNRRNWTQFDGVLSSVTFGKGTDAGPPRQIQVGVRMGF